MKKNYTKEELDALYAMEPICKDQEIYNVSTALSSHVIPTNKDSMFTVISNVIRSNLSFVDDFILKSAEHLSGISK